MLPHLPADHGMAHPATPPLLNVRISDTDSNISFWAPTFWYTVSTIHLETGLPLIAGGERVPTDGGEISAPEIQIPWHRPFIPETTSGSHLLALIIDAGPCRGTRNTLPTLLFPTVQESLASEAGERFWICFHFWSLVITYPLLRSRGNSSWTLSP